VSHTPILAGEWEGYHHPYSPKKSNAQGLGCFAKAATLLAMQCTSSIQSQQAIVHSQALDMTIAERRPVDALQLLKSTEKSLLPAMKSGWVPADASASTLTHL
jgi:hypothetical protein